MNAFERLCTEQGWVFTEIPQQTDFGKDGYVDIVVSGEPTGLCVAVQIKGGPSFRKHDGYRIPTTERLREFWKFSTTPVFGIVWDADADACFWTNVTEQLWSDPDLKAVKLKASNRLPETSDEFMDAAFHASVGSEVAAALGGDDEDRQINAIWDIRALGRHDHRHLVLLRRVMFGLRPRALDFSIVTLNDLSLNFDVLKTSASVELGAKVRPTYLWSVDEAVELLDRVRDEGNGYFSRGTFGAAVYWLLVGADLNGRHFPTLVERATQRAASEGRANAAAAGLILLAFWAEQDGMSVVERLVAEHPDLRSNEIVMETIEFLTSHGRIEL